MKKLSTLLLTSALSISLFAGIASAHVNIYPKETTQGKYEVFTVRVPSEKENTNTTKIQVKFPDGVSVSRFEPKPGWKYEVERDASGKIIGVTWTAEGEGLSPIEFGQFNFQGKVGEVTELTWKAFQTYKDGSVVEWIGSADSEKPASVTKVAPKIGTDTHSPAPSAVNTSAMQPVRLVAEQLGAKVTWDQNTKTVNVVREGKMVALTVGEKTATVDNHTVTLAEAAYMKENRVYVPVGFLSESFGVPVHSIVMNK